MKIPLTQDMWAIVDDEDYETLKKHKWYAYKSGNTYYARRNTWIGKKKQTAIQMHREVMGCGSYDGTVVDHINFNGLDNRKENLQVVPHSINIHRRKKQKNNTSGYVGIYWKKKKKYWEANIRIGHKLVYVGCSKDPAEAAKMRDRAVLNVYHENAILNFPLEGA